MGAVALAGSIIDGILQVTGTITNGVVKSKEMKYGAQVQVSENEQGGKSNRLLRFITKCSTLNSKQEFTKELPKNYQGTTHQLPTTKHVRLLRFTGGYGCPLRGKVFRYAGSVRVGPSLSRQVGNPSGLNTPATKN